MSSSYDFNGRPSGESISQDSLREGQLKSQDASNLQENQSLSENGHKTPHQVSQSQHAHNNFDQVNQDDVELGPEVQFGIVGYKKIKKDVSMPEKNQDQPEEVDEMIVEKEEAKQSHETSMLTIGRMFQLLALSQGNSNLLYQHHQCSKEERNAISESFQKMFSKKCRIANSVEEITEVEEIIEVEEEQKNQVTFSYLKLDMKDHYVKEILGKGFHGLVIKLKDKKPPFVDSVLKLYTEKEAFIRETTIISIVQRASGEELPNFYDPYFEWNNLENKYFKIDKYYGLFVKAGLGSLWDFKKYLATTEQKLTDKELFVLTYYILCDIKGLHEVSLCHRDIKPGNIVLNFDMLARLIDFSFASEMSKAEGNPGTEGYRMKDFSMENQEQERREQLISGDYFAFGLTILEITFPNFKFRTQKDLKDKITELKKFNSLEKKILAETLEICIFGKPEITKDILKEERKTPTKSCNWKQGDETKKEKLKDNFTDFGLYGYLERYARMLKDNHYNSFKNYMAEKWATSSENSEPELQKHAPSLNLQPFEMRENSRESTGESFRDRQQAIQNYFIEYLKQTLEKCCEVIDYLLMTGYIISDAKLYFALITVICFHDSLNDKICFHDSSNDEICFHDSLDDKITSVSYRLRELLEEKDSIFFNRSQSTAQENFMTLILKQNELYFSDLMSRCSKDLKQELIKLCKCAHGFEKETDSETLPGTYNNLPQQRLAHQGSEMERFSNNYLFMNYCKLLATQLDQDIDNSTRDKIKEFVYGVNFSEREYMLDLLNITELECVVFTLNSFCEILKRFSFIEKWADLKTECMRSFREGEREEVWLVLLSSVIMHIMIGFIILYNYKYDLTTKFNSNEWLQSEEVEQWDSSISGDLNKRFQMLQAEQTKKWSRQRFFNSILLFLRKAYDNEMLLLRLDFDFKNEDCIFALSVFGHKLKTLLFPDFLTKKRWYNLRLDFKSNSIDIVGMKLELDFSILKTKTVEQYFASFKIERVESITALKLQLSNFDQNPSRRSLHEICDQLRILKLMRLKITIKKQIEIKDNDFEKISKFISNQDMLEILILEFDLCLITSEALISLADDIQNHENLEELKLVFKNCPSINEEPIKIFLEKVTKLAKLTRIDLSFCACLNIVSFEKPEYPGTSLTVSLREVRKDVFENLLETSLCGEYYNSEEEKGFLEIASDEGDGEENNRGASNNETDEFQKPFRVVSWVMD